MINYKTGLKRGVNSIGLNTIIMKDALGTFL